MERGTIRSLVIIFVVELAWHVANRNGTVSRPLMVFELFVEICSNNLPMTASRCTATDEP
eukprot:12411893-Karenia_brevis.AAC.1